MDVDVYNSWEKNMTAKEYLLNNIKNENKEFFGVTDPKTISNVTEAWMDDKNNSKHRLDTIRSFLPNASKILDMASGCGTCVYYGLLNDFDIYGIEPEQWKHDFNKLKAKEYGYPDEWQNRLINGFGELLPFKTNYFDCVSTYQTLEHVNNTDQCISEMIRVTKSGGGIHIACPDYRSTFEAHYMLPWIPLFPQSLAKIYLKLLKRPTKGLATINYTTAYKIKSSLIKHAKLQNKNIKIINVDKYNYLNHTSLKLNPIILKSIYYLYYSFNIIKSLFNKEFSINFFVYIDEK